MDADAMGEGDAGRDVLFQAVLHPNRSLGATGFVSLMLAIAGLSFAIGIGFVLIGAWPVSGFFGLDVLLLYVAFRVHRRRSEVVEHITLDQRELAVRRIEAGGRVRDWSFEPYWVSVHVPNPKRSDSPLLVGSHGQRIAIGGFLTVEERTGLSLAINEALSRLRDGMVPA